MALNNDPNCRFCAKVVGVCVDCDGCFREHCLCDPCAHGHERAKIEECVFCRPLAFLREPEPLDDSYDADPIEEPPFETDATQSRRFSGVRPNESNASRSKPIDLTDLDF